MRLEQLAEAYLEQLKVLNRRPSTLLLTRTALRDFLGFLGEDRAPTRRDVEGYRIHLKESGLAEGTTYGRFRMVSNWLSWGVAQNHLLVNPADNFQDKAPHKKSRYTPTVAEMTQLLDVPKQHLLNAQCDRLALEILYGAGLRRSELLSLDLQDYQRQPPALLVRAGKGLKDRLVPIGDQLQELLESYLATTRPRLGPKAEESALLLCRLGTRFQPMTFEYRFRRHRRRVGLPQLTIHSLRHAYASHLLAGGAKVHEVQLLLGHRRMHTTERYTHLFPLELLREYRRTHPRAVRRAP